MERTEADSVRVPPHSNESEQAVLGGVMQNPHAWDSVADVLAPRHFYRGEHRAIFAVVRELADEGHTFDPVIVADTLENRGEIESAGGWSYVAGLAQEVPAGGIAIRQHAQRIVHRAGYRVAIEHFGNAVEKAYQPTTDGPGALIQQVESDLYEAIEGADGAEQKGVKQGKELVKEVLANIDDRMLNEGGVQGLSTGIDDVDEITTGLHGGRLYIVAGRPSMGKTTFALNLATAVCLEQEKTTLIYSLETRADQLQEDFGTITGGVDREAVRRGEIDPQTQMPDLISSLHRWSEAPIYIDDNPTLTPDRLVSQTRRMHRQIEGGLGMVVIDYLQLMEDPANQSRNTAEIVAGFSRAAKKIANELDIPVIGLCQLNRNLEQRSNKRPMMADLRESGAIEQDADAIIFLHCEARYDDSATPGLTEAIVAKQRNGPIGTVNLMHTANTGRFSTISPDYAAGMAA